MDFSYNYSVCRGHFQHAREPSKNRLSLTIVNSISVDDKATLLIVIISESIIMETSLLINRVSFTTLI
jgi:hypothetical protein